MYPAPSPPPATWSVWAEGLTKDFGTRRVVNGLNLAVGPGEFFGFLGPNGAGKTTTIRMLVGLLRPTAGRIVIAGHDLALDPLGAKASVGLLPEELNLYERLTAREFLHFAGTMYGLAPDQVTERTEELLRLTELTGKADDMIVDYSAGMKKKTALAAALIHDPRVLVLDEPFNGVDAVSSRAIRDLLQRLLHKGTTVFFSSHILDLAQRLCTRVAIIHEGCVRGVGTLPELRRQVGLDESATLEDVFLLMVGARPTQEDLSWVT